METYALDTRNGETLTVEIVFKDDEDPIELTGYEAFAQIREYPESPVLLESFSCQVTENEGKVSLSLSSEQTRRLFQYGLSDHPFPGNAPERKPYDPVYLCWDFCLENETERTFYIGGPLVIYPVVTVPEQD